MDTAAPGCLILVVDVADSTRLYNDLGDLEAKRIIFEALDQFGEHVDSQNGEVIATIGDEMVCQFNSIDPVGAAAGEFHLISQRTSDAEGIALRVSIGIHGADPTEASVATNRVEVAIARWICDLAKPEQTLVSEPVVDRLPPIYRALTRFVDEERYEGTPVRLHELVWEVDGLTANAPAMPRSSRGTDKRAVISFGDQHIAVDADRTDVSIGRGRSVDMNVPFDRASREHCTVSYKRGRCFLTDNSTNGTTIVSKSGISTTAHRETVTLRGEGSILLGTSDPEAENWKIAFICE